MLHGAYGAKLSPACKNKSNPQAQAGPVAATELAMLYSHKCGGSLDRERTVKRTLDN